MTCHREGEEPDDMSQRGRGSRSLMTCHREGEEPDDMSQRGRGA